MRLGWLLACVLAAQSEAAWAQDPNAQEFGPLITLSEFQATAEEGIRARLKDPESARFTWPYAPVQMTYKPMWETPISGYLTCGLVNGKNSYGGYTGNQIVMVMVRGSEVTYVEMRYQNLLAKDCANMGLERLPTQ